MPDYFFKHKHNQHYNKVAQHDKENTTSPNENANMNNNPIAVTNKLIPPPPAYMPSLRDLG